MTAKILEGNVLETLKDVPACSVQCAVTSPPYYGLRDYGVAGQIGLEPTPEAYVENLVAVFREVRRVLKDDGTLWLNLGDSYAGSGRGPEGGLSKGENFRELEGKHKPYVSDVIKPKDLIGIPWMVAFALRADGWYLRQDIIWNKPNPMPESVTDRCTKAHEYIFLLTKSRVYYYNQDAIRVPYAEASLPRALRGTSENNKWADGAPGSTAHTISQPRKNVRKQFEKEHGGGGSGLKGHSGYMAADGRLLINPLGRNKWSVWEVPTVAYKEAHFATFPPDLIQPCILAGSKEGDIVLDPFNGSGTTGEVSIMHNRSYIGCELNPDYVKLTKRRLSKVQPFIPQQRAQQSVERTGEQSG
jgi:DNA modification methylase